MSRRDDILARLENASKGPWVTAMGWADAPNGEEGVIYEVVGPCESSIDVAYEEDAEFIAHAPEDMRWLLERVNELEAAFADFTRMKEL